MQRVHRLDTTPPRPAHHRLAVEMQAGVTLRPVVVAHNVHLTTSNNIHFISGVGSIINSVGHIVAVRNSSVAALHADVVPCQSNKAVEGEQQSRCAQLKLAGLFFSKSNQTVDKDTNLVTNAMQRREKKRKTTSVLCFECKKRT
jgi:hypothetical protein